jgi:hypothetical protein
VDSDQPGDGGALTGLISTSGYAEQAAVLARRYERVTFEAAFGTFLPYLPVPPCRVADIGAGTGRDAAWLGLVLQLADHRNCRSGSVRLPDFAAAPTRHAPRMLPVRTRTLLAGGSGYAGARSGRCR